MKIEITTLILMATVFVWGMTFESFLRSLKEKEKDKGGDEATK